MDKTFTGLSAIGPLYAARQSGPADNVDLKVKVDDAFDIPKQVLDGLKTKIESNLTKEFSK